MRDPFVARNSLFVRGPSNGEEYKKSFVNNSGDFKPNSVKTICSASDFITGNGKGDSLDDLAGDFLFLPKKRFNATGNGRYETTEGASPKATKVPLMPVSPLVFPVVRSITYPFVILLILDPWTVIDHISTGKSTGLLFPGKTSPSYEKTPVRVPWIIYDKEDHYLEGRVNYTYM